MMIDLFGKEVPDIPVKYKNESPYQRFKRMNNFKVSSLHYRRCGKCDYLTGHEMNGKNYYKCQFMTNSKSVATDIRLKNICDKFRQKKEL